MSLDGETEASGYIERREEETSPACPPIDLEYMLGLEQARKMSRMSSNQRQTSSRKKSKRPSFISIDDVPRRGVLETNRIVEYLRSQGFTSGLARTLMKNTDNFPVRIWLIDNGSSMNNADGHLVVAHSKTPVSSSINSTTSTASTKNHKIESVNCTRWEELRSTLLWHAHFCTLMEAPTAIRFVNPPKISKHLGDSKSFVQHQQLGLAAEEQVNVEQDMNQLKEILNEPPDGKTSILSHLSEIVHVVAQAPPELLGGRSMSIIVVTDRLPVDENGRDATSEFIAILKRLEHVACWIVIRLSTDDTDVVEFYGNLDNTMVTVEKVASVHLDVLDDYVSEAEEVHKHNPWLNYAYPLHLCRESAVNFPVFDVLNDRPLVHEEVMDFVSLLFDRSQTRQAWNEQPIPNPKTQYSEFREEMILLNKRNGGLYNPIKQRIKPWIDIRELDRIYSNGTATSCACEIM